MGDKINGVAEITKVRKYISFEAKGVDEDRKVITFRGTTGTVDREGDIVVPQGGNLSNFRRNPIFLWAHDWRGERLPIGKSLQERIIPDEGVEFDIQFDAGDPFAMDVFRKYKDKFLNAVSIGFWPQKSERIENEEGRLTGRKFTEWELLELSGVPIPANPDALQMTFSKFLNFMETNKEDIPTMEAFIELRKQAGDKPELKTFLEQVTQVAKTGEVPKAEEAVEETGEAEELPFTYDHENHKIDAGVLNTGTIKVGENEFTIEFLRNFDKDRLERLVREEDQKTGALLEGLEELGLSEEEAVRLLQARKTGEESKPQEPGFTEQDIAEMVANAVERKFKYLSGKVVK